VTPISDRHRVASCNHGRPLVGEIVRVESRFPIEISGGLALAAICVVALSWPSSWRDETASAGVTPAAPPGTIVARPYRHLEQSLTAFISYNRTLYLIRVENRDAFPWANCQVSLNSHGISAGYDLGVKSIRPGLTEAALVQSGDFTDPDGRQFDPSGTNVSTLDVACETPKGRLYYAGKFGTQSYAIH
jgi:hypothetical protein